MMAAIERKSQEEIREFQNGELKKLITYLERNSPFYQKLFKENNIKAGDIQGMEGLVKIPVTTKDQLQQHNWDFLCVERSSIVEYCSTSGTMGSPVHICLTQNDVERLAYNEYLSFLCTGGMASEIYQLMLTLDRQFMAGIAYYSGIRKLGAGVVRMGPGNLTAQLESIQNLKPDVLVAVPSFILSLIKFADEKGFDLNNSSVKKIICIGENIRNEDLSLNELGKRILATWDVKLFSTYASTEKQSAFTECEAGRGGHHQPELLVFEVLDENDMPLPPGVTGELAITTLGVEGMPLLRYKTGDMCRYFADSCACGRNTYRISPVICRKQQLIKYNGTTLYPQTVFNILNSIEDILDFVVEVSKNDIGTDDLKLHLSMPQQNEGNVARLKQVIQSKMRVLPQINFLPLPEIQKLQVVENKRKASKFIDHRQG